MMPKRCSDRSSLPVSEVFRWAMSLLQMLRVALLLAVCSDAAGRMGGMQQVEEATKEVQTLIDDLRGEVLSRAQAVGWQGADFERFEAKTFKTQMVAGMNYFVKVVIADDSAMHL